MRKLWIILLLCLLPVMALAEETYLPAKGRVVGTDVQVSSFVMLTQTEDGACFLYIYTYDQEAEACAGRCSGPWPAGTSLDTSHTGEGDLVVEWGARSAYYLRQPNGEWHLSALHDHDTWDCRDFTAYGTYDADTRSLTVGSMDGQTLFTGAVGDALFDSAAQLDRTGWARIDAIDGAALYQSPGEDRFDTFFGGTPVKILEEQADWLRVMIGTDGSLTGWLRRESLAFGDAMDAAACHFPDLTWKNEYYTYTDVGKRVPAYASASMTEQEYIPDSLFWIVGEHEDGETPLYILLDDWGNVGYVPKDWLFPGNG